ncbi:MAG: DUF7718 family protein [Thermoplasmatota archaeon]
MAGDVAVRIFRLAVELEPHRSIVDLKHIEAGGGLVEFVVQFRIFHDDAWMPVVRYDNCHGGAHIHRFWKNGRAARRLLPARERTSITAALDWAEADLALNWRTYRTLMIGKLRQQSYQPGPPMEE